MLAWRFELPDSDVDVEVFKHREVLRENDGELLKSVMHPQLNPWRFQESAGSRDENA